MPRYKYAQINKKKKIDKMGNLMLTEDYNPFPSALGFYYNIIILRYILYFVYSCDCSIHFYEICGFILDKVTLYI